MAAQLHDCRSYDVPSSGETAGEGVAHAETKETLMYGPRTLLGPEVASTTRGVLYVHSAPSALCPHVEWAVGGVLGLAPQVEWTPQSAQPGTYRAEYSWAGDSGTAAALTSALRGWDHLRFEVTEESTSSTEGARYSVTPGL